MPRLRAISISGLVSELKVTIPSTSAGAMPASSSAASTASTARRSSVRPDSLENSVAPMPAMAVVPAKVWGIGAAALADAAEPSRTRRPTGATTDGAGHVVAEAVGAPDGDRHHAADPSSPSGPLAVTDPVSVMVSPG